MLSSPRIRMFLMAVSATVFCIPAGPAVGQNALGDGQVLDRNLQDGSGGRNQNKVRNTSGIYNNAIVTGNAGGLGRFRGDIDYGAAGEFRDSLGSNDFYDFDRRSYGLELGGQQADYSGDNWLRSVGPSNQPDYMLRAGSGVTSGEVSGQYERFDQPDRLGDYDAGAVGRYQMERAAAMRQQSEMSYTQQSLGAVVDYQGRALEINATPLTGLTTRRFDTTAAPADESSAEPTPSPAPGTVWQHPGLVRSEPMPLALSVQLGEQLHPTMLDQADKEAAMELSDAVQRLLGSTTAEPGSDVYMDLLRRINESTPQLNPPINRLIEPAPQTPEDEIEPASELPREETDEEVAAPSLDQIMQEVVGKLDYDLPPMQTLAGQPDELLQQSMTRAEQFMAAGRFFDAEAAYNSALRVRPGYPLAIVGKVHAQLGAGLYRSSASTLVAMLSNHPELIAARYSHPLLPDDKRLETVLLQLRYQLKSDSEASAAALLLAYLGYQMDQPQWVNEGLDHLDRLMPDHPLTSLLHRIWAQQPAGMDVGNGAPAR